MNIHQAVSSDLYSGERQVSPTVDGIRADHVRRYEWAARTLAPNSRVLDIACGVGYGAFILAQAGHRVTAIDISADAIAYAKEHFAHPGIDYGCSSAEDLPSDLEFDAVVSFETIEHLADPEPTLQRWAGYAPVLLASVPNESVFPHRDQFKFHHRHYTARQLHILMVEAGYAVVGWYGQAQTYSDVEPAVVGRTIVVRAEREYIPFLQTVAEAASPSPPEHVVVLGLGPSLEAYVDKVKRLGSRKAFANEVWGINAIGDVIHCDRIFHMDDVRIQEIRAEAAPESNIANMLGWLRQHPGPIYTSQVVPGYPGLVEFPLEAVINSTGFAYFNGTVAYAVAYALHLGVKRLSFFGCDFTYSNSHHAERGRACLEFWLGMAVARGIEVCVPDKSTLMDACEPDHAFYGYDAVKVGLSKRANGSMQVTFEPVEKLPTAEEIEARYNHEQHPNTLMRS